MSTALYQRRTANLARQIVEYKRQNSPDQIRSICRKMGLAVDDVQKEIDLLLKKRYGA